MSEDTIYKSVLNVGNYEIRVKVIDDEHCSPLEFVQISEVGYNPLPINSAWYENKSPFDYANFSIDNLYHNAYFVVDACQWNEPNRYFVFDKSVADLQTEFIKLGYARHDAWLKALDSLKLQAKYIQDWFNNDWHFVGLVVEITESFTDENGLIWSRELESEHDSLWGVEWSSHAPWANQLINNEQQFKNNLPDLLPENITLTDGQLNDLWLNLDS